MVRSRYIYSSKINCIPRIPMREHPDMITFRSFNCERMGITLYCGDVVVGVTRNPYVIISVERTGSGDDKCTAAPKYQHALSRKSAAIDMLSNKFALTFARYVEGGRKR